MAFHQRIRFIAATLALASSAAVAAPVRTDHVESELVAENLAIQSGRPFVVGLRLKMDSHWHTYWTSPGDSGAPTSIAWTLPEGFSAGEMQWPHPIRIPTPPYMTFGYEGEVLLMTTITPPANLAAGTTVKLAAHADWLVCREVCIPGQAGYTLELPVQDGAAKPDPACASLFAETRHRLPVDGGSTWPATFAISGNEIVLRVTPPAGTTVNTSDLFFYPLGDSIIEPAEKQAATFADGALTVRLPRAKVGAATPTTLSGVLVANGGFPPSFAGRSVQLAAQPGSAVAGPNNDVKSLGFGIVLLGFVGGLILNLMPCVFPVLGIKVLGFVHQSGSDRRKVTMHGVVFTAGVLMSFWVLAGVLIALRAGGQQLGWGFQLQSPAFVFGLAIFLLIFALNLSGLFEVGLSATSVGGSLQSNSGYTGSFFTGVLATVVSTPCAAPFLAPALGAALTLPAAQSILLFSIIGLGLSMPYLVLSIFPGLVKLLPRPGAWMEGFKQLMAFPLYATVGFLIWVLAGQVKEPETGLLKVLFGLVLVAMAAWGYGRWSQHGGSTAKRSVGFAVAAALLLGGFAVGYPKTNPSAITWEKWSPESVAKLRAEGKVLYVDFTARWCATCQSNKALVFGSKDVVEAFRRKGVVPLKADWTNKDPEITRALAAFGRSAVPFNLIYAPGSEEPILLPELLTPGKVLDALDHATAKTTALAP